MDCAAGILVNDGKIVIAPQPDQRLGYLHASYDSPYGKITSDWKYEKNRIVYTFEIPANMTATMGAKKATTVWSWLSIAVAVVTVVILCDLRIQPV